MPMRSLMADRPPDTNAALLFSTSRVLSCAGGEHVIGVENQGGLGHVGTSHPRAKIGETELDVSVRTRADDQGDAVAEIRRGVQRRSVGIVRDHGLPLGQDTQTNN